MDLIPSSPFQVLRNIPRAELEQVFENFRLSLYRRIVGTPDVELPKIKAQIELVNTVENLVNTFLDKTPKN